MSVSPAGNSGSATQHTSAPSTTQSGSASGSSGAGHATGTGSAGTSAPATGIPGGDTVQKNGVGGGTAVGSESAATDSTGSGSGASSSGTEMHSLVNQLANFIQQSPSNTTTGAGSAMGGDTASTSGNPNNAAAGTHSAASANIPAGATNVAGRDHLNLNKPIYVPMKNGDYDPKAIKAIGDQSLHQAGMTQAQAKADHGPHHGNAGRADGSFTIANGYAKGVLNGAAAIYGANANGYTSLKDHKYAVTQSAIETGSGKGLNGRQNFKQQHVAAGAGSDGQGPIQLDGKWHDQRNSNMPVVAFTRGYGIARKLGHGNSLKKDGLAYNQGFYGGNGQTVGHEGRPQSYGAYWDKLVNRLNSRPQAAPAANGVTRTHQATS